MQCVIACVKLFYKSLDLTCIETREFSCFFRIFLYRSLLMKTLVPQKANDLFDAKDRSTAPEEFVRLFLMKEENAQLLETKTGNNDQTYLNITTSIGWFDIISFVPMSTGDNM